MTDEHAVKAVGFEESEPEERSEMQQAAHDSANWERANRRAASESRRYFVAKRLNHAKVQTLWGHGHVLTGPVRSITRRLNLPRSVVRATGTLAGMDPHAVLLDAGGVFVLPDPERVLDAFSRAECAVDADVLADAHYRAATRFTTDLDVDADWSACWLSYLQAYIEACGVDEAFRHDAHRHVDNEFADAGLWIELVPGCREGLAALAATGVRLGIVSNADGLMGSRLAGLDVCQVGPGIAVEVECVIDSGNVGVMKPDPRIFHAALDVMGITADQAWYIGDMPAIDVVGARRAGLRPFVIDPLGLHHDADYDRVGSLTELAELIDQT